MSKRSTDLHPRLPTPAPPHIPMRKRHGFRLTIGGIRRHRHAGATEAGLLLQGPRAGRDTALSGPREQRISDWRHRAQGSANEGCVISPVASTRTHWCRNPSPFPFPHLVHITELPASRTLDIRVYVRGTDEPSTQHLHDVGVLQPGQNIDLRFEILAGNLRLRTVVAGHLKGPRNAWRWGGQAASDDRWG